MDKKLYQLVLTGLYQKNYGLHSQIIFQFKQVASIDSTQNQIFRTYIHWLNLRLNFMLPKLNLQLQNCLNSDIHFAFSSCIHYSLDMFPHHHSMNEWMGKLPKLLKILEVDAYTILSALTMIAFVCNCSYYFLYYGFPKYKEISNVSHSSASQDKPRMNVTFFGL